MSRRNKNIILGADPEPVVDEPTVVDEEEAVVCEPSPYNELPEGVFEPGWEMTGTGNGWYPKVGDKPKTYLKYAPKIAEKLYPTQQEEEPEEPVVNPDEPVVNPDTPVTPDQPVTPDTPTPVDPTPTTPTEP